MKKIYSLLFLSLTTLGFAQGPFTAPAYDFAGVTTTSGANDPSTPPSVPGINFGSFTAVNTVTAPTNSTAAGRFSFINQPLGATNGDDNYANLTGTLNTGIYYEVTVQPNPTGQIDISTITFTGRRSSTGVRTFAVRSSVDGFANNLPASVGTSTLVNVQANNTFFVILDATTVNLPNMTITLPATHNNLTGPVTFRFYGFNAEGSGGTFGIDDVVFSGNIDVLSSNSFNQIAGLNMYPNPVKNGILKVETDLNKNIAVEIFDFTGKKVLNTVTSNNQVDVSKLNSGIYTVKFTEEDKISTKKLILE